MSSGTYTPCSPCMTTGMPRPAATGRRQEPAGARRDGLCGDTLGSERRNLHRQQRHQPSGIRSVYAPIHSSLILFNNRNALPGGRRPSAVRTTA